MPVMSAATGGVTYNMGNKMSEEEYITSILGGCLDAGSLGMAADGIGDKLETYQRRLEVLKTFGGKGIMTIKPKAQDEIIKRIRLIEEAGALAFAVDIDSAGRAARAVPGQIVEPKTPKQLEELAKSTSLPFIIKGIMTVEEAKTAVEVGARGIVVSNHGGRVLDYTPATCTVLPAIAEAVKGKLVIFADGAVRRGPDVLKLLALGADCCLVGRPLIRGAHGGGREGVALMMNIFKRDLTDAMVLTGTADVKKVSRSIHSQERYGMNLTRALIILALLVLPGNALATDGGKALRYGGGGQGPVIFDGRGHAGKGYVCNDCHLELFATAKKARISMSDHFTDKLCFKCHNNKKEDAPRDCALCHRKVASSGLVYSDYMRDAESKELPDGERELRLTGRLGVTEQSRACLSCHGKPGLEPKTERGKTLRLYVTQPAFSAGTHGALACASCHFGLEGEASFAKPPHAVARPATVNCQACHSMRLALEIESFNKSAHMVKLEGRFVCANCHNIHALPREKNRPGYLAGALEYNAQCLSCHGNPKRFAEVAGKPQNEAGMAHSFLAKWSMHGRAVLCADCHTPAMRQDSHLILVKDQALRDCYTCHRSMDSLILTRAALRDGNGKAFAQSYIPAVKAPGTLDLIAGYALGLTGLLIALHAAARALGRKAAEQGAAVREYLYPLFMRVTHWVNAACIALLIWTGLGIRFEGLAFVPGLEAANTVHSASGIVLIINYLLWLAYAVGSGDIRQYLPGGAGLGGRLAAQTGYYLFGMFTGQPKPFAVTAAQRFNPLQQVVYCAVFLCGMPLLIISGVLMLLPEGYTAGMGARETLAAFHYCMAILFALFFAGHVYLATTGDTLLSLTRSMFTGFYEHLKQAPGPGADKGPR